MNSNNMANGLNTGNLVKYAGDAFTGGLAGAGADAMIEFLRVPFLNNPSPFFPNMSNAESLIYGVGGATFVLGMLGTLSKSKLGGSIGTDLAAKGLGAVVGTYLWETMVAPKLGGFIG